MKMGIILLLIVSIVESAFSNVLITYFDAFDGGKSNNSKPVALGVASKLSPEMIVNHCELTTAFGAATKELIDCINNLPNKPDLIISLGEYGCKRIKLETVANNWAFGNGRDNLGQIRSGEVIIEGAPEKLGLNIDWAQAFCGLDYKTQKSMTLASSSADSYVCNETMYNMSYYYPELPYGFIHVPRHNCRKRNQKVSESIEIITHLIKNLINDGKQNYTPYMTTKPELQSQMNATKNECQNDFLRRLLTTY